MTWPLRATKHFEPDIDTGLTCMVVAIAAAVTEPVVVPVAPTGDGRWSRETFVGNVSCDEVGSAVS